MKKLPKVAIIDYGMGNLFSVIHACKSVGLTPCVTSKKDEIINSSGAILPGVGAFGEAMNTLKKLDLVEPIKDFIKTEKPFLAICLGMQLLFSESEEFGCHKGMDIIKGVVVKFSLKNKHYRKIKVPQVGWNQIFTGNRQKNFWKNTVLKNIAEGEFMYFVHSYYSMPENKKEILTVTDYEEIRYCSGIIHKNISAFQFHPEKSAAEGIKIYYNWAETVKKGAKI